MHVLGVALMCRLYTTRRVCWRGGAFAAERHLVVGNRLLLRSVHEKPLFRMDSDRGQVAVLGRLLCGNQVYGNLGSQIEEYVRSSTWHVEFFSFALRYPSTYSLYDIHNLYNELFACAVCL